MTRVLEDTEQGRLIISGGKDWRSGNFTHFTAVRAITSGGEHIRLEPDLPEPLADHCMVITRSASGAGRRLWVLGGTNRTQRYPHPAVRVSRVEVHAKMLDDPSSGWTRMPDLLDARQWQGWRMALTSE